MEEIKSDIPIKVTLPIKYDKSLTITTKKFIESLSYKYFALAGNSVANMIENIPIRDLDFWVLSADKFIDIFTEFSVKLENPTYIIYPSMIEIKSKDVALVNLILSNKSIKETINEFDFDYCRCYYTKEKGIYASEQCLLSIFTKNINHEINYGNIRKNRILKALDYGYTFNRKFWCHHKLLICNKRISCKICTVVSQETNDPWHGCRHVSYWTTPYYVSLEDLDMNEFEKKYLKIDLTDATQDVKNIDFTEIKDIIANAYARNWNDTGQLMLPKLLVTNDKLIVKEFISNIIMFNPVRAGNYVNFNVGLNIPGFYMDNNVRNTTVVKNTKGLTYDKIKKNGQLYKYDQ